MPPAMPVFHGDAATWTFSSLFLSVALYLFQSADVAAFCVYKPVCLLASMIPINTPAYPSLNTSNNGGIRCRRIKASQLEEPLRLLRRVLLTPLHRSATHLESCDAAYPAWGLVMHCVASFRSLVRPSVRQSVQAPFR